MVSHCPTIVGHCPDIVGHCPDMASLCPDMAVISQTISNYPDMVGHCPDIVIHDSWAIAQTVSNSPDIVSDGLVMAKHLPMLYSPVMFSWQYGSGAKYWLWLEIVRNC